MKQKKKKAKRKQSNLSRALASSNRIEIVHERFFANLSAGEIRVSASELIRHRHFSAALHPNRSGAASIYVRHTPSIAIDKCVAWCLGLLQCHSVGVQSFLNSQDTLLNHLLSAQYDLALETVRDIETVVGISAWSVSLQGTLLSIIDHDARRAYVSKIISDAGENGFFKALTFNLTNRFDDPETLQSESRFFELKIKRTFVGSLLHFLMYKLVPYNVDFRYDIESIINFEKDSSPIDIIQCLIDILVFNIHAEDETTRSLCRRTLMDLRRHFSHHLLDDLAIAYGLLRPTPISSEAIGVVDLYTAGDYQGVCLRMAQNSELREHFGLVEIWAKALARIGTCSVDSLPHILAPLKDVVTKSEGYERSRASLLAYCHAFGSLKWFRELRYLLERETRFYDVTTNDNLRQMSSLLSSLTTPAKAEVLVKKGFLNPSEISNLVPDNSVTAQLFNRMRSSSDAEPSDDDLAGIENNRRVKFRASWYLSREKFEYAIPLLQMQLKSDDMRVAQDASRALVEAYRATSQIERAADVYAEALLENTNLLSVFDSAGLAKACSEVIKTSRSISVPIVFSIHSRFIGDAYDAALKYGFECFLRNSGISDPLDLANGEALNSPTMLYFLRYICTPEVMKLYLFFETPKQIEQCRIEICKILLGKFEGDEELVFEVKERTRRLVLKEAVSQVQGSRIFSDANLLSGPSSSAFKALYERFAALRLQNFEAWDDEVTLAHFLSVIRGDALLLQHAHTIHVQDLVLNEKNSVFLKLVKLVRDEFAFGEKGLNVYLSTRIRHGHFPNTIRKPLLDNALLASRATDTSGYKLSKDWLNTLRPEARATAVLEQAIIDFSVKFNELVDEVNDNWLRIFTIDQDISGLSKDGEVKKSIFNYSVTAVETYYLQSELSRKASYTEFIAIATKWLWERTELNLSEIRDKLSDQMSLKAFSMLEELGKTAIQNCGIESLGNFPDALARARSGLVQAFETVQGWFTRARGVSIQDFELDIAVQISRMAADVEVTFKDSSGLTWEGAMLNPLVDAFYILFENAVSKSGLSKNEIEISAEARVCEGHLIILVENHCASVGDIAEANAQLDRYRDPMSDQSAVDAAQGEGGSGFFKLWRLFEKDMNITHCVRLGYTDRDLFRVKIEIPLTECKKVCVNEDTADRRRRAQTDCDSPAGE